MLAHAGVPYVTGGYTGVDVFFVISGFLITTGLLKEAEHTGSVSLRRFCARRAVRILPLATLVALVTMVGCRLFASKIRYTEFMHDALAGPLYVMNIDLAVWGTDYLTEGSAPSPFQHFWSLSVEEQFYLLWPVLLLASRKLIRRPALRALPLGALCLISYVQGVQVAETSPSWAYFGPHTRPGRRKPAGLRRRGTGTAPYEACDTWPKDDPVECAASRPLRLRGCEPDQRDAVKDPTRREAGRQGARRAGAAVVDPRPWLCPRSGGCPVAVGDTFVYRDESHLAESYVEALAPVLRQELRKQGVTDD
ncbi:acyltransferase family protein [Streptomyces sp. NPDC127074]|uniref:acyltransferase family protein n=1 Tax=Streptomyces sp. NPDC127074 TaxID=3347130 RepID=UPI00365D4EB2